MKQVSLMAWLTFVISSNLFSQGLFSTREHSQQQPQQQQLAGSPLSMWVNAVLAYNFEGDGSAETLLEREK
jgi:hypothetical protein